MGTFINFACNLATGLKTVTLLQSIYGTHKLWNHIIACGQFNQSHPHPSTCPHFPFPSSHLPPLPLHPCLFNVMLPTSFESLLLPVDSLVKVTTLYPPTPLHWHDMDSCTCNSCSLHQVSEHKNKIFTLYSNLFHQIRPRSLNLKLHVVLP